MSERLYRLVFIGDGPEFEMVPVERCVHGKIDGHDVPVDVPGVNKPLYDWCEGAGIGDTDE